MIYGSVCSGIEAASVAWEPLGWHAAWFAEIDPFCNALLDYHYPEVPNLGDFTKIPAEAGPVDLLVAGTPCQSFSVAGRRSGLDDPRGNLTLEYLKLAARLRPRWIVWENVPGVLSIDGGRTFGAILGTLAKLGYALMGIAGDLVAESPESDKRYFTNQLSEFITDIDWTSHGTLAGLGGEAGVKSALATLRATRRKSALKVVGHG